jgi:hypothetical protein|tara:strand:- start:11477 stop:11701 length:225 start_codon:yes stop_codon:yes gene_type:complete
MNLLEGCEMINKKALVDQIIEKAGIEYKTLNMKKNPYSAPELFSDKIISNQVKAIAKVIVDELVDIIEKKGERQ